jgi:tetratricopeptide (TPR) repeat protein
VTAKIPRARAARQLEQARLHLQRGEAGQAVALLEPLAEAGALSGSGVEVALGEAWFLSGDVVRALAVWRNARSRFPDDAQLAVRIGMALARQGELDAARAELLAAERREGRDPLVLSQLGHVLLRQHRPADAAPRLQRALQAGAGPEVRLWLGHALARQGRYADAEAHFAQLAGHSRTPAPVKTAARSALADCRLFGGDAAAALADWMALRGEGSLDPAALGHAAYAAQLAGDAALSDALAAERIAAGATAEDRLLFAQVANLRGEPNRALELLAAVDEAEAVEAGPGLGFECLLTRARALRLLGRTLEARALLEEAQRLPEAESARLAGQLFVDLGLLALGRGEPSVADAAFRRALELDPGDPEALQGLARLEVPPAQDAARAAAEASLRRRVAARDEVESLRAELEQLRAAREAAREELERARAEAREAEAARKAAEARSSTALSDELAARDREIVERTHEALRAALGPASDDCPGSLRQALEVAERTWQQALYTDLPPAAVGVLYTGVLERALYLLLVEAFRAWLSETGQLRAFLDGATRERRGRRVEYFDHFVEAFDEERPGRAPSLGEVQRTLERRGEPYLAPWRAFLSVRLPIEEAAWDDVAAFVRWSKLTLRDPVAHGRATGLDWASLRRFREGLLESLAPGRAGVIRLLLDARRAGRGR